jgi:transposase
MSTPLVSDGLWAIIAPLLPTERPKPKGGRPRIADRAALTGILFVLKSGIPWELLPQELGYGSGMTCWRRLRDWQQAGIWAQLHRTLLQRLQDAGLLDWERAALDSASVPAPGGASRPARIRRIVANWVRNATSWLTAMASHSPYVSRARMCMTVACWRRVSMRSQRCGSRTGGEGDRVSARRNCMQIKAMITLDVAKRCVAVGSFHVLRAAASIRASG